MSDIDTAAADSLKVLDPERPIREADIDAGIRPLRVMIAALHHSSAVIRLMARKPRRALHDLGARRDKMSLC